MARPRPSCTRTAWKPAFVPPPWTWKYSGEPTITASSCSVVQPAWRKLTRPVSRRSALGSRAPDDGEPRLRPALRELDLGELRIDLEPGRLDGLDLPAAGEGVVQFSPRNPPRPLRPRFLVAHAQQE